MNGKIALAAGALVMAALAGCGGGSSRPPAWCKPAVSDIETGTVTTQDFQTRMQILHDTQGAPAYLEKVANDQARLADTLVSSGLTELGTPAGQAVIVRDLRPIAAACRVSLSHLKAGLLGPG